MPTFQYTVDDEPYSTSEHTLTARQILQLAGKDPNNYYLKQIKGQHQESYKDKLDEPIQMHQHMKFITIYNGSTGVSWKVYDG